MRRSVDALFVQRRLELVQPRRRHAVRGRAPVAAGAEAAAHRYLGGVGKGRTLELACLEEAEKEDLQPLADGDRKSVVLGKRVSVRVDLGGSRTIKKKKNTKK